MDVVQDETENRYKVIQVLTCPKHLWHDVTDPTEVERLLLEKNKRHLQQIALEKGVSTRSLITDMQANHGTSMASDALLEGRYLRRNMKSLQ